MQRNNIAAVLFVFMSAAIASGVDGQVPFVPVVLGGSPDLSVQVQTDLQTIRTGAGNDSISNSTSEELVGAFDKALCSLDDLLKPVEVNRD